MLLINSFSTHGSRLKCVSRGPAADRTEFGEKVGKKAGSLRAIFSEAPSQHQQNVSQI